MPLRRKRRTGEVQPQTEPAAAQAAAVALLARRDFASAELSARLCAKGFDTGTVQSVLAELTVRGTLNEARYAENYVAWHSARGQGPLRIAAELRRQQVPEALIETALATGPDWYALARKVCRAKFGPQPPQSWAQKARQARFLQYRGFSADHIRSAVDTGPDTGMTQP
jgi:regulatory protein